jgi:glutathione S-transferase
VDVLYEGTRDFLSFFMSYGFQGWDTVLENAKKKGLPKYLPPFENALLKNGSNHFLVGNKLSIADIGLLEVLLTIDELLGVESLSEFVELKKFYENIKSIQSISNYLLGSQRPKKNDETYVQTVRKVLQF